MKVVKLGKYKFRADWLASVSLEEAKKTTRKNTPEGVIERLWIEVNGKPKKEKPKKKDKESDKEK